MRRKGAAMLIALAVLAGLVALVGVLSNGFSVDLRSQTDRMDFRRAQLMADSGIQKAVQEIQSLPAGKITLSDEWATLGNKGSGDFTVGPDSFRIQIIDSCSKLNLNLATEDFLKKLPLSSDQVECLLDWREKKDTPRPDGAKDEYYTKLSKPYYTKMQPLGSFDELLQIRNFTPNTLFDSSSHSALSDLAGVDSISADSDPNGKPKIDIRSATAAQLSSIGVNANLVNSIIQSQGAFQKMGDVLSVQGMDQASAKALLNYCAVGGTKNGSGLINVNTAPKEVLELLPDLDSGIASSISDRQADGFVGLGDLVDVPGLELSTLAKFVDQLCVSSRTFEVRVGGFAGGYFAYETAELVLDDKGNVNVIRIQPSPFTDTYSHWGWPAQAISHETVTGDW